MSYYSDRASGVCLPRDSAQEQQGPFSPNKQLPPGTCSVPIQIVLKRKGTEMDRAYVKKISLLLVSKWIVLDG